MTVIPMYLGLEGINVQRSKATHVTSSPCGYRMLPGDQLLSLNHTGRDCKRRDMSGVNNERRTLLQTVL